MARSDTPKSKATVRQHLRLLRTAAAAEYLCMSAWKLRQLVLQGRLSVVQDVEGGPFLFDVRDLDAYVERYKRTGQ